MLCVWHGSRIVSVIVAVMLAVALQARPANAAAPSASTDGADAAGAVVDAARSHIGASYQYGGTGPAFDCSGLVYRVFKDTHELRHIGGNRRTAAGFLRWFRAHHRTSRRGGKPADLVIYGNGTHIGIYLGHGKVVSAIVHGVRRHGLRSLTVPFTVFLHTRLGSA